MKAPERLKSCLQACCIVLMTTVPASAATFGELLARAKAEAAAGHNWDPPGDNVADTVMTMMDLTPTATPQQLAELIALLRTHESVSDTAKAGTDSVDASIEPTGRGPVPVPVAEMPTAAKPPVASKPLETQVPDQAVAVAPPQTPPPSAGRGPGNPAGINTIWIIRPGPHAAALSQRGHDAELSGDISGARRFYAKAAELGDAVAALCVGRLYDPAFVERNTVGGIQADPAQARFWYERAAALGNAEAKPFLQALSVR
jgi:hypothetical protein